MVKVWLREERFEAALPLGSRSVRPLTPSLIHDIIRALRDVDPQYVQCPTWITEAWRHFQWGEPTAKLLWEMLLLFQHQKQGRIGDEFSSSMEEEEGGGSSRMAWESAGGEGGGKMMSSSITSCSPPSGGGGGVYLSDLCLFLYLHLPDALSKVSTHPSTYNITRPPTSGENGGNTPTGGGSNHTPIPLGSPIHAPTLFPPPSSSFSGPSSPTSSSMNGMMMGERAMMLGSSSGSSTNTSQSGGISIPGASPLTIGTTGNHAAQLSSSPMSPRSSSPRSYFQMQAWSKTEAHHVTFIKRHLRDMLIGLIGKRPTSNNNHDATANHHHQNQSRIGGGGGGGAELKVSGKDFNALGFLLAGGEGGIEGPVAARLSDLVPFWQGRSLTEGCPFSTLASWLDDVLCVNEVLYPPASDTTSFALPPPSGLMMDRSQSNGIGGKGDLSRPLVVSAINYGTVVHTEETQLSVRRPIRAYIQACHDANIYLLGPMEAVCITGVTDSIIVLGAVSGLIRVMNCERTTVVACGRRLVICNCLDSIFPVFVTMNPVLAGDNRGCRLAPYNSCYPGLTRHLAAAALPTNSPPAINHWNNPLHLTKSLYLPSSYIGLTRHLAAASLPTNSPPAINHWNNTLDLSSGRTGLALGLVVPSAGGEKGAGGGEGGFASNATESSIIATPMINSSSGGQGGGGEIAVAAAAAAIYGSTANSSSGGAESRLLPPEQFYTLTIPVSPTSGEGGGEDDDGGSTTTSSGNENLQMPFALPLEYATALRERSAAIERLQRSVIGSLREDQRPGVEAMVVSKFYEWLSASGNLRQVLDLIQMEGQQASHRLGGGEAAADSEGPMMMQIESSSPPRSLSSNLLPSGSSSNNSSPLASPTNLMGRVVQEHQQHHYLQQQQGGGSSPSRLGRDQNNRSPSPPPSFTSS